MTQRSWNEQARTLVLLSAALWAAPLFGGNAQASSTSPKKRAEGPAAAAPAKPSNASDDDPLSDDSVKPIENPAPAQGGAAGAKHGPNVLVLPFQPIFRSVAQNKIQTANELLHKELSHRDNLIVIRGGVAKGQAAEPKGSGPTLEEARRADEAAGSAETRRDISTAIEQRRKVIEEMEKNAALVDPDDYVAAHLYLGRALMWAGQDKEANDAIEAAARMRPLFKIEPAEFSRLYRKWFAKAAERAIADKPGDLVVGSALPGAEITLDGRSMDVAPVLLKKVVPGKHLLGARIEGVPPFAATVEVKSGKKNVFNVVFSNTTGGSSVGAVADAIAQNSIPKDAVSSAVQAGKDAGAQYVVAGALARDEDRFHVHTFIVDVASASVATLEVIDFDLELLTAESDVLRIVQNITNTIARFPQGEKAIAVIEKRIRSQTTMNEVAAAPSITNDDGGKHGERSASKKNRKVYQPLKATKVMIKDEEE